MQSRYDIIGGHYNRTRQADPGLVKTIVQLLGPVRKGMYLDIGCGTGNYTLALYKCGFRMIGVDPSARMLTQARKLDAHIQWLMGSAEDTGLDDSSITGVFCSLSMHHWRDIPGAMVELKRVCTDDARMVIFTSTPAQMKRYWLNHYFPGMMEKSIRQMPQIDAVMKAMRGAGFTAISTTPYDVEPGLKDLFLYCGKHDPERYFQEHIRNGISSFSALSNQEEVQSGLRQLRMDIESGAFVQIAKDYAHTGGDYLFLCADA